MSTKKLKKNLKCSFNPMEYYCLSEIDMGPVAKSSSEPNNGQIEPSVMMYPFNPRLEIGDVPQFTSQFQISCQYMHLYKSLDMIGISNPM